MKSDRIAIVGAGIVGLATALKLNAALPDACITIWEKEIDAGRHQSTHNSGVLHAGVYYQPGSLKAQLSVQGIREMVAFCEEHGVPHEICGKVIVATTADEAARLGDLHSRGLQNGLRGLKRVSGDELREIEPMATGCEGLLVPEEGIVDYAAVVQSMKRVLEDRGVRLRLAHGVERVSRIQGGWSIESVSASEKADFLVNCAGLQSDRVAHMAGENLKSKIVPFRGEYFKLRPEVAGQFQRLIYPVPDPSFPFLGVHLTKLIRGGVEAGPNAVLALAREGYGRWNVNLRDAVGSIGFAGLYRFLLKHPGMCMREISCSLSKNFFCHQLRRLVPSLRASDLVPGGVGVRAQAMSHDGKLIQDFHFIERADALHVINAPSPAATASLSIGQFIAKKVVRMMGRN
jgi:L-2-hydroxyglutarate oxidase LhgO